MWWAEGTNLASSHRPGEGRGLGVIAPHIGPPASAGASRNEMLHPTPDQSRKTPGKQQFVTLNFDLMYFAQ